MISIEIETSLYPLGKESMMLRRPGMCALVHIRCMREMKGRRRRNQAEGLLQKDGKSGKKLYKLIARGARAEPRMMYTTATTVMMMCPGDRGGKRSNSLLKTILQGKASIRCLLSVR